jgi:hypothetical protein
MMINACRHVSVVSLTGGSDGSTGVEGRAVCFGCVDWGRKLELRLNKISLYFAVFGVDIDIPLPSPPPQPTSYVSFPDTCTFNPPSGL